MDGSSASEVTPAPRPRGPGRPSTVAPYKPLVAQWLARVRTFQASKSCGASGSPVSRWQARVLRARETAEGWGPARPWTSSGSHWQR
jgi:hypothetical protein